MTIERALKAISERVAEHRDDDRYEDYCSGLQDAAVILRTTAVGAMADAIGLVALERAPTEKELMDALSAILGERNAAAMTSGRWNRGTVLNHAAATAWIAQRPEDRHGAVLRAALLAMELSSDALER